MRTILTTCLSFICIHLLAQEALSPFENLVGSRWEVKGKWSNGEDFRQEYTFEWSLGKKMIKVQTFGTTNMLTGEYGLRNEGVRYWKEDEKKIKFYEFDVFGGITEGVCTTKENSIVYEYVYGGLDFRETWEYKDQNTYTYIVESLENGKTKEVYQTSTITRK